MPGQVIAGRYELEELVGAGGMSSVFRARDRLLERKVALKILHEHRTQDEDYVERFRREARAAARLSHPNIVTVIDRGEQDGRQFIVFEYVEGETLKELLERTGPLPVRDALDLGLQVAGALAFAHEHGLVHRDVKPQNVLLDEDGRARVTDFGIARSLGVEGVTQTGTVLGTSDYIAPEQARGERVDAQSDVYSLGVVLFELLTGRVPFEGDNFVAVAMRHVNEPAPSVLERRRDVPLRLAAAVDRALAKDPADRFGSMEELAAELEAALAELEREGDGEATMVIAPVARARARRRRSAWPLAVLLLGLTALAVIAVAALTLGGSVGIGGEEANGGRAVPLAGLAAFDPEGDGREHDEDAPGATDRDPSTYWTTERYRSFQKSGVGLVLDAGRPVEISRVSVVTDTPGFRAEIRAGPGPAGPFRTVAGARTVSETSTFELSGGAARYYVVWITDPGPEGRAHVNEVRARGSF